MVYFFSLLSEWSKEEATHSANLYENSVQKIQQFTTAQSSTVWEVRTQFHVEFLLKQKIGRSGRKRQTQCFPATILLHLFLIKYYQSSCWNGVSELFHFYFAILAFWTSDEISRLHGVLQQDVHFSSEMNESLNLMKIHLSVQSPSLFWREHSPDPATRIFQSECGVGLPALFSRLPHKLVTNTAALLQLELGPNLPILVGFSSVIFMDPGSGFY